MTPIQSNCAAAVNFMSYQQSQKDILICMAARGWLVVDVAVGSMSMLSKDLMKPEVVKGEEGSSKCSG